MNTLTSDTFKTSQEAFAYLQGINHAESSSIDPLAIRRVSDEEWLGIAVNYDDDDDPAWYDEEGDFHEQYAKQYPEAIMWDTIKDDPAKQHALFEGNSTHKPRKLNIYKLALDLQYACNLSAMATSLADCGGIIWEEARAIKQGTEYVNTHPVVILFLHQMAFLATGHDPDFISLQRYSEITEHCERESAKFEEARVAEESEVQAHE